MSSVVGGPAHGMSSDIVLSALLLVVLTEALCLCPIVTS